MTVGRIVFRTTVIDVSRKDKVVRARRVEEQVVVDRQDLGWTILLEGSRERLFVGDERPDFQAGDEVTVTIEGGKR